MGIHNFKSFLNTSGSDKLEEYDSIFIDIQSYLYKAIQYSFKSKESELKDDICFHVTNDLAELFENLFSYQFKDTVKIIISFDGESLPMKFPTQKQRRNVQVQGKNIYKIVLFGHNTISEQVRNYIIDTITKDSSKIFSNCKSLPSKLEFSILGSDTKGEGEHKLFSLGYYLNCRNPVIASVDNDVFIIALSQLSKFDSIQIYKAKNVIFDVNKIARDALKFDKKYCIYASLLFGNDFIPPVINLTESNCPIIHEALQECSTLYMPHIFCKILSKLKETSKIRFKIPPHVEESIILEFWKNCFWVLDYYEKYNFPQKYMDNFLFDIFEKNQVIVALLDEQYSENCYKKALSTYTESILVNFNVDPKEIVFTQEQLKEYKRFFPQKKNPFETYNSITVKIR